MKRITLVILIVLTAFLIGATAPPKKYPAQTGTYKVNQKSSSKSSAKGVGGICFIDTSQY